MGVILFALMILIIFTAQLFSRKSEKDLEVAHKVALPEPELIDGVAVSTELSFHPFHTWAHKIDSQSAVVGIDDFGRRFVGPVDAVILPEVGTTLETGQYCVRMRSGERYSTIISPLSGEVVELNPALHENPNLIFTDPYGKGWMFKLKNWKLLDQIAALFSGKNAIDWMKRSIEILRLSLPSEVGVVAQDGGLISENLSENLDRFAWMKLVRENLGTESTERIKQDAGS